MIDSALQKKIYKPSDLMELFNNSFAVLKYVWKDILIMGGVVLGPVYVLIGLVVKLMANSLMPQFQEILDYSQETTARFSSTFWPLYAKIMLFAVVFSLILMVAHMLVILAINLLAFRRIRGETINAKTALAEALHFLPKVILQKFLLGLIIMGLALAFGVCLLLFTALSALISPALSVFLGIILYIAMLCFIFKLMISYSFAEQTILFEESTAAESFAESSSLVRGSWWRVFGISMLLSIVVSFAAQLVTSPIIAVSLLPTLNRLYEFVLSAQYGNTGSSAANAFLAQYMESMQRVMPLIFVGQAVSVLISMLFSPLFMLLFYIDLRARKEPWRFNTDEPVDGTNAEPDAGQADGTETTATADATATDGDADKTQ